MAPPSATPQNGEIPAEEPVALKSRLLERAGFAHGFFTRRGGISEGPFSSLNFTTLTGDSESHVSGNVRRVAHILGIGEHEIFYPNQVHGTAVVPVGAETKRSDVLATDADTVVTRARVAAAIRTADCVPVLLASPSTGWVSACHAGWKGCVRGAVLEAVRALRARGAPDLIAAIGPHISVKAFEVSPDVAAEICGASPDPDIQSERDGKLYIDLRKMVMSQLVSEGLARENIDHVYGCTVSEPALYYSFRRDGEVSGRQLSAIVGGIR
jgi:polyphenol oxidase